MTMCMTCVWHIVHYMYDLWTPMYDLIMTYGSVAIL